MNARKIAQDLEDFAKVAKFRQIWPHSWLSTIRGSTGCTIHKTNQPRIIYAVLPHKILFASVIKRTSLRCWMKALASALSSSGAIFGSSLGRSCSPCWTLPSPENILDIVGLVKYPAGLKALLHDDENAAFLRWAYWFYEKIKLFFMIGSFNLWIFKLWFQPLLS